MLLLLFLISSGLCLAPQLQFVTPLMEEKRDLVPTNKTAYFVNETEVRSLGSMELLCVPTEEQGGVGTHTVLASGAMIDARVSWMPHFADAGQFKFSLLLSQDGSVYTSMAAPAEVTGGPAPHVQRPLKLWYPSTDARGEDVIIDQAARGSPKVTSVVVGTTHTEGAGASPCPGNRSLGPYVLGVPGIADPAPPDEYSTYLEHVFGVPGDGEGAGSSTSEVELELGRTPDGLPLFPPMLLITSSFDSLGRQLMYTARMSVEGQLLFVPLLFSTRMSARPADGTHPLQGDEEPGHASQLLASPASVLGSPVAQPLKLVSPPPEHSVDIGDCEWHGFVSQVTVSPFGSNALVAKVHQSSAYLPSKCSANPASDATFYDLYLSLDFGGSWRRIAHFSSVQGTPVSFTLTQPAQPVVDETAGHCRLVESVMYLVNSASTLQSNPAGSQCFSGRCDLRRRLLPVDGQLTALANSTLVLSRVDAAEHVSFPQYTDATSTVASLNDHEYDAEVPDHFGSFTHFAAVNQGTFGSHEMLWSSDGGSTWRRISFDHGSTPHAYVLNGAAFGSVLITAIPLTGHPAGVLYVTDPDSKVGTRRVLDSVVTVRRTYPYPVFTYGADVHVGHTEGTSVMANVWSSTPWTPGQHGSDEFSASAALRAGDGCIVSVKSNTLGATWYPMYLDTSIGTPEARVHLFMTQEHWPFPYAPHDTVGLVLAQGNVGACLKAPADSQIPSSVTHTFASDDSGWTWRYLDPEGGVGRGETDLDIITEVTNHGNLVASAQRNRRSTALHISSDGGRVHWSCSFDGLLPPSLRGLGGVYINNILTDSFTGNDFVVEGVAGRERSDAGFVLHVEMESFFGGRTCALPGDYEFYSSSNRPPWAVTDADDGNSSCVLGVSRFWHRRRRGAQCTNPSGFVASAGAGGVCTCTRDDFECDYCYSPTLDNQCVIPAPADTTAVCDSFFENPITYCYTTGDRYYPVNSSGYVKLAHDMCVYSATGGVDNLQGNRSLVRCPGVDAEELLYADPDSSFLEVVIGAFLGMCIAWALCLCVFIAGVRSRRAVADRQARAYGTLAEGPSAQPGAESAGGRRRRGGAQAAQRPAAGAPVELDSFNGSHDDQGVADDDDDDDDDDEVDSLDDVHE